MKARYWLLLVILASFLLRVPIAMSETPLDWDSSAYAATADYLVGKGYYFEDLRAPLTSVLLVPFALFGVVEWGALVLGILSLLGAFLLFREITNEEKAVLATAILSFSGLFYSWTTRIAVENSTVLVLSLLFYLFIRATKEKDKMWLIAAFAMGAVAVLLRYYFVVAFVVGLIYYYRKTKSTKYWLAGFAVFVLLLIPWASFNYAQFGDPLHSVIESSVVFAEDTPNYQAIDFYLQNWWQIADLATWIVLLIGLAAYKKITQEEWLLGIWLLMNTVFIHLSPVKEVRFFVPVLPAIAYFVSRPLDTRQKQALVLVLVAVGGLPVMFYSFSETAQSPCLHHTGVALASQGLEGTVMSTHWPITAYYSKQPVEKLWYDRNRGEVEEAINRSDWLVYAGQGSLTKEELDSRSDMRFVDSFGPECSQAFLYEVIKN